MSQADEKKAKDGSNGRHSRKSSSSNRALPGYSPQNDSPPPAYENAVQRFSDATPAMFRPQSLSNIRNMNLES